MKWMFWRHADTLRWKLVSCLPRPSLLCCPPLLLFIRRLPKLQHGGVRLPTLSSSPEPWCLLCLPVQFKQAFKRYIQLWGTVLLKVRFPIISHAQNHKYENVFCLPCSLSTPAVIYRFLSITLLSPHLQVCALTQPHSKPHPINLRHCASSFLLLSLSIHPLRFECSSKRRSAVSQHARTKPA